MEVVRDIEWFKKEIIPLLKSYDIKFRFWEEGDFGSLNQVVFNSEERGGNVDFWGLGWIGIDMYDYKKEKQLLNILIESEQEKEEAFEKLKQILLRE